MNKPEESLDLICIDPELGALLSEYLENRLSDKDKTRFEYHLKACQYCEHAVAEHSLVQKLTDEEAPLVYDIFLEEEAIEALTAGDLKSFGRRLGQLVERRSSETAELLKTIATKSMAFTAQTLGFSPNAFQAAFRGKETLTKVGEKITGLSLEFDSLSEIGYEKSVEILVRKGKMPETISLFLNFFPTKQEVRRTSQPSEMRIFIIAGDQLYSREFLVGQEVVEIDDVPQNSIETEIRILIARRHSSSEK